MKIENFLLGKGKIGKIFHGMSKIVGNRGKSETGGEMHHFLRRWTPLMGAQFERQIRAYKALRSIPVTWTL